MKKLLIILLSFSFVCSYAQKFPVNRGDTTVMVRDAYLQAYRQFVLPVVNDTTLNRGNDSLGSMEFRKIDSSVYVRNVNAFGTHYWQKFLSGTSTAVTSFNGRIGAVIPQTGDYNATQVTNAVNAAGGYFNPTWITGLSWSVINGTPTTVSGYGITDAVTLTGTQTLTNKTLTAPTINVGGDQTGDIYYRSSIASFARLGIGSTGQVLTVVSGLPAWANGVSVNIYNSNGSFTGDRTVEAAGHNFLLDSAASVFIGNLSDAHLQEWIGTIDTTAFIVANYIPPVGANQQGTIQVTPTYFTFINKNSANTHVGYVMTLLDTANGIADWEPATGSSAVTIYNGNGSIGSTRTVTLSNSLTFSGTNTSSIWATFGGLNITTMGGTGARTLQLTNTVAGDGYNALNIRSDVGQINFEITNVLPTIGTGFGGSITYYSNSSDTGTLLATGGYDAPNAWHVYLTDMRGWTSKATIEDNSFEFVRFMRYTHDVYLTNSLIAGDIGQLINSNGYAIQAQGSVYASDSLFVGRTPAGTAGTDSILVKKHGDSSVRAISPSYYLTAVPTTSINGTTITFGSSNTITAAAGTLTGTTLNSTVVTSSLTSVGTMTTGTASTGFVIAGVTMTLGSDANYDIYYRNSSGVLTRLANGTTGQFLGANTSAAPSWQTPAGGVSSVSGTANRITSTGGSTPVIDISASYVGQTSITTLGTVTTGTWTGTTIAIANGGTGVTSVTISPTASAWAGWDANKNLSANNFLQGYTTTATAAGTTTLTVSSAGTQYFTGSTTQTVTMPVVTTLVNGQQFTITNLSSGVVTVQTSGSNTIQAMAANTQLVATVTNTAGGTGTASWSWTYVNTSAGGSGAATVSNSDGTLTISPTSGAVVASLSLSHANTWTGVQTFNANALATTTSNMIVVNNTTAAAAGSAQVSPAIDWQAFGWGTTLGSSQQTDLVASSQPAQGTTPLLNWTMTGKIGSNSALNFFKLFQTSASTSNYYVTMQLGTEWQAKYVGGGGMQFSNIAGGAGFYTQFYDNNFGTLYIQLENGATFFNTKTSIGTNTTPTAKLLLGAGSSSANTAPLQFTSGAVETTIRAGLQEYNNSYYISNNALNRTGVGGVIADFTSDAGNSGTSETDLYTYTTKASTLAATGEKLTFTVTGNIVGSATASRTINLYFAGTNIGTVSAATISTSGSFKAQVEVIRTGSTTARASCSLSVDNLSPASTPITETDLTGLTFTNTNIIKITGTSSGTGSASNDIVAKLGYVSWFPAANN